MNIVLGAGPPATAADQLVATQRDEAVSNELTRIRAAALAWRNGAATLLVGIIGFGLIKGRSDINDLATPFGVVVGILLGLALLAGVIAALLLLRAANGRPAMTSLALKAPAEQLDIDHSETVASARALRAGLWAGLACTVLLAAAVATTWYGPPKDTTQLIDVSTPGGMKCGEVVRVRNGILTLKADYGEIDVDMRTANGIESISKCDAKASN